MILGYRQLSREFKSDDYTWKIGRVVYARRQENGLNELIALDSNRTVIGVNMTNKQVRGCSFPVRNAPKDLKAP